MQSIIPEHVGLSGARLSRIRPMMQAYIEQQRCAGMLAAIARRGDVAYLECFGQMDIEATKLMAPDTIFRIYSMTKPITTVAMLMLYEEGKFQLSDPVSRFIPAFRDTKVLMPGVGTKLKVVEQEQPMTIGHLLTHTAGLSYGFDPDSTIDAMYRETYRSLKIVDEARRVINPAAASLADAAPEIARIPMLFQPGTVWHYSIATDIIGYLVQILAKEPFDRFLQQRIFEPLQMQDTGFYVPQQKLERLAAMYAPAQEGGLQLIDAPASSPLSQPPNFLSGGGGLVSTAADYLRFAQMLLNHGELDGVRLLSRKTVEFMLLNHLPAEILQPEFARKYPGYGCGLGGRVLLDVAQSGVLGSVGSFGWGGLASSDFWIDPHEQLIGLILPQQIGDKAFHVGISQDFRVLTYQAIVDQG